MPDRSYEVWSPPDELSAPWARFYAHAMSFRQACQQLLRAQSESEKMYHEVEILPPLYCFHHHLELFFKALILENDATVDISSLKGHGIFRLLTILESADSRFRLSDESRAMILELDEITDYGLALRYPINVSGDPYWVSEDGGRSLTLANVVTNVARITHELNEHTKKTIFAERQPLP